ncbi:MAG: ABC transporter permease [Hyphomicrobiales bacterium]|nr:MAG: ABC transporter permease [Hyphomicrobiales bacterium]
MNRSLSNIFRLGVKELRGLRADPVLVPLIAYMFTFAVYSVATGAKFEVEHAAVAIVDEDRSDLSRRIRDAVQEPYFKIPEEIPASEIDRAMDLARFVFVIEIPPKLESDVGASKMPSVQINVDATAMTQAGNGAIYLQNIISREALNFAQRAEGGNGLPINLVIRSRFNPNLKSEWFVSVMQVINNITILSVVLTGAALIREREQGTIEHLLVMPVTPLDVMLSKIWANGLVIIVAALLSLWLVVQWLLQVPIAGSIALFVAGAILYQFTVTALGIFLATFTTSMAQFGLLVIPVLMVMNLLSGSTTPMESMPAWLQGVMQVSPAVQFVSFSQAILYRGADFSIVWPQMAVMTAISAIFVAASLMRFRKAIVSV